MNWLVDKNNEQGTYENTTKESRINLKEFFSKEEKANRMKGRIGKLEDDSKRRNKLEERYKKTEKGNSKKL